MKRFSRETYPPSRLEQVRKDAKFQSYIKQLADIIRVYEKREGLGKVLFVGDDPYDRQSDEPEHKLALTIYSLGQAQNNEGKEGIAAWPNWEKDILQEVIREFGINDKNKFRRIMMYFGNIAANNPDFIRMLIRMELQKNL